MGRFRSKKVRRIKTIQVMQAQAASRRARFREYKKCPGYTIRLYSVQLVNTCLYTFFQDRRTSRNTLQRLSIVKEYYGVPRSRRVANQQTSDAFIRRRDCHRCPSTNGHCPSAIGTTVLLLLAQSWDKSKHFLFPRKWLAYNKS